MTDQWTNTGAGVVWPERFLWGPSAIISWNLRCFWAIVSFICYSESLTGSFVESELTEWRCSLTKYFCRIISARFWHNCRTAESWRSGRWRLSCAYLYSSESWCLTASTPHCCSRPCSQPALGDHSSCWTKFLNGLRFSFTMASIPSYCAAWALSKTSSFFT